MTSLLTFDDERPESIEISAPRCGTQVPGLVARLASGAEITRSAQSRAHTLTLGW